MSRAPKKSGAIQQPPPDTKAATEAVSNSCSVNVGLAACLKTRAILATS